MVELYLERCERYLASGEHEGTGELDLIPEWREEFSIGVAEIDAQHRQLLEQMRRLSDRVRSGSHGEVNEVLDFLGRYVVNHFRDEEHLMRDSHYPFLEQHVHEHRTFQTYCLKLREEIENGNSDPTYINFRIQLLLVDWLINHTTKTDRHLGCFLRNPAVLEPEPGFVH